MNDKTHETIRQIKASFRGRMNGIASKSMSEKGVAYKINWGIPLPELKQIAGKIEYDYDLVIELWKENIRECKILATLISASNPLPEEVAEIWIEDVDNQLIVIERPVEMQLRQLSVAVYRRMVHLVFHRIGNHLFADERHDFVEHISFRILENTSVVGTEDEFVDTRLVLFHLLERQERHESHLIAIGREGSILLNERLRQCLLEDGKLIDVSFEAATEVHTSADTTEIKGFQG